MSSEVKREDIFGLSPYRLHPCPSDPLRPEAFNAASTGLSQSDSPFAARSAFAAAFAGSAEQESVGTGGGVVPDSDCI